MARSVKIGYPKGPASSSGVQIQKSQSANWRVDGDLLHLELDSLQLPTETYSANAAWVEREGTSVEIFLGKTDRDKVGHLKTRVEFRFSIESFDCFWKSCADFFPRLNRSMSVLSPEANASIGPAGWKAMEAEKEHVAAAALAIVSHNGTAAELDFFDLPVTEIAQFHRSKDLRRLQVRPLLRVFLAADLLLTLLQECAEVAEEIKPLVEKMSIARGQP
jgi:hypothetical protein